MRNRRVLGIVLVLLALAAGVSTLVVTGKAFSSLASWSAPGTKTVQLSSGQWTIFQQVPEGSTAMTPGAVEEQRTVDFEQLKVTGPNNIDVPLTCAYCASGNSAAPVDFKLYNAVANFSANVEGEYTITSTSPAATLAVADPVSGLESAIPLITLLGFAALVLLIIGVVLIVLPQKGRQMVWRPPPGTLTPTPTQGKAPALVPTQPEAGWYANPYMPGTASQMWWDGKKWTSNWREDPEAEPADAAGPSESAGPAGPAERN